MTGVLGVGPQYHGTCCCEPKVRVSQRDIGADNSVTGEWRQAVLNKAERAAPGTFIQRAVYVTRRPGGVVEEGAHSCYSGPA
jgi:hypothetical protein